MSQDSIEAPTVRPEPRFAHGYLRTPYLHSLSWLLRIVVSYMSGTNDGFDLEVEVPTEGLGAGSVTCNVWLPDLLSRPSEGSPLILIMEGGGFILGHPKDGRKNNRRLAQETKAVVLSVDYAKAPRYPYPHALLQCYDVLRWSMTSTAKEQGISVDPKRVIIQGNSAGGNLTAALSLLISFSDGPCAQFKQRLPSDFKQVLQVLLYPSLELTRSYSERLARTSNDKAREKSLPAWLAGMMEESYLPPHISKHQMFIAPAIVDEKLLRDLNLASALLLVGDHDCLLEENTMYAEKLKQTGKLVRSEVIAEGIHGFTGMQNTIGYKRSWDIVIEQIKEAIE